MAVKDLIVSHSKSKNGHQEIENKICTKALTNRGCTIMLNEKFEFLQNGLLPLVTRA